MFYIRATRKGERTQAYHNIPKTIVKQECSKHFEYIMKTLLTVKIYIGCKWTSKISELNIITTKQKIKK